MLPLSGLWATNTGYSVNSLTKISLTLLLRIQVDLVYHTTLHYFGFEFFAGDGCSSLGQSAVPSFGEDAESSGVSGELDNDSSESGLERTKVCLPSFLIHYK